jgi:O-succinylhomoserine sulfhydrylase
LGEISFFAFSSPLQNSQKSNVGDGAIVTFEINVGFEERRKFLNKLQLFSLTPSLGDAISIAAFPAFTIYSKLKAKEHKAVVISEGLVRLSIGLEHVEDIWKDL